MKLTCYPFDLLFSEVFAVSSNARTSTEVIYVELTYKNFTGYGEASFPPYMKEKRNLNLAFLKKLDLTRFESPFEIKNIWEYMDQMSAGYLPAKCAIDIALHDLLGKIAGLPLNKQLGLYSNKPIETTFTIGIGNSEFIERQLHKSAPFKKLKIKLGADLIYNKITIEHLKSKTTKPFGVDFNQGLANKEDAIEMITFLNSMGVLYIEQPLPESLLDNFLWLKDQSPIPIFGDESFQTAADIIRLHTYFDGINIKLMKCGGISKALEMASIAKNLGLKLMLGCMAESSCAVTAASQIASLFDEVDLDGNLIVANDPFTGIQIIDGIISANELNGCGFVKN